MSQSVQSVLLRCMPRGLALLVPRAACTQLALSQRACCLQEWDAAEGARERERERAKRLAAEQALQAEAAALQARLAAAAEAAAAQPTLAQEAAAEEAAGITGERRCMKADSETLGCYGLAAAEQAPQLRQLLHSQHGTEGCCRGDQHHS